ncbi:MAG: hypothetical protein KDA80_05660 [Planctomycetaceae bacterium]|nr:hypothetical protein [Planctomycetaceae bacterium]
MAFFHSLPKLAIATLLTTIAAGEVAQAGCAPYVRGRRYETPVLLGLPLNGRPLVPPVEGFPQTAEAPAPSANGPSQPPAQFPIQDAGAVSAPVASSTITNAAAANAPVATAPVANGPAVSAPLANSNVSNAPLASDGNPGSLPPNGGFNPNAPQPSVADPLTEPTSPAVAIYVEDNGRMFCLDADGVRRIVRLDALGRYFIVQHGRRCFIPEYDLVKS